MDDLESSFEPTLIKMKNYLKNTPNAFVGEIGLDAFRRNIADMSVQMWVFQKQWEIAAEYHCTISLHLLQA